MTNIRTVSALAIALAALVTASPLAGMSALPQRAPALERFTVHSDGHPMAVWARVPAAPSAVVLLVHGRTWSSVPDFDLQVPGMSRSVMMSLADRSIAAYAVDLRGYGGTPRDSTGWLTPRRAAGDVVNVIRWVAGRHPTLSPPALVGWSRGAAIALLAAQSSPPPASSLVLFGFAYDPSLEFADGATTPKPLRLPNTRQSATSDFISPLVTPRAVVNAFVAQALKADPVLVDLARDSEFNDIDVSRLAVPTLVLYGDRDPAVSDEVASLFLAGIGPIEKNIVVLRGGDHAAQLEDTHDAWIAAVAGFIVRPGRK